MLGDGPGRFRMARLLFLTAAQLRLWPVTLADKGTSKKQDIKITGASTLASDEVDRMVKDAEQYADEDKKQREAVDVKNQVISPDHSVWCFQNEVPCSLLTSVSSRKPCASHEMPVCFLPIWAQARG